MRASGLPPDLPGLLDPDRPGRPRIVADLLREALGTHYMTLRGCDSGRWGAGHYHLWRETGHVPKCQRPVCGARTRKGSPCQARAVPGKGRCRMHGGASTGPTSADGRARIAESNRRRAEVRRARAAEAAPGG